MSDLSLLDFYTRQGGSSPAPIGPIAPLVISGRHASEQYVAIDAFAFLQNYLDWKIDDCDRYCENAVALGIRELRVFGMWAITNFDPRHYDGDYYNGLRHCAMFCQTYGLRFALDALTSCQDIQLDKYDHFARCVEALDGLPNARVRLGNEWQQNGFDPATFPQPTASIPVSRGSAIADVVPPIPAWVTMQTHSPRDGDDHEPLWVKSSKAIHELYVGDLGQNMPDYKFTTAGEIDEPIACGETDEPGRTSANPFWFWQFTCLAKIAGAFSVTAHWRPPDPAVLSLPGPRTSDCIRAMVQAMALPLGKCFDGQWRHTGSDMSIYSTDRFIENAPENPAGTMDSYEMQQGNCVEYIGIAAGPQFDPSKTQYGASIVESFSYAGEPPTVFILSR
jgi:hypothetical protein